MKVLPGNNVVTKAVTLTVIPLAALLALSGCHSDEKAQPAPLSVVVSHPAVQNVKDVDVYAGRFEAVDTVDVRPRVSGYLEQVAFRDGALVKKGGFAVRDRSASVSGIGHRARSASIEPSGRGDEPHVRTTV